MNILKDLRRLLVLVRLQLVAHQNHKFKAFEKQLKLQVALCKAGSIDEKKANDLIQKITEVLSSTNNIETEFQDIDTKFFEEKGEE